MDEPRDNVVKLIYDNVHPTKPACTTCLHYHPDVSDSYATKIVTWHLAWPFRRVARIASSWSHHQAVCSYFGGHHACTARNSCQGENWEQRDG
jgi:hypothetical protein